MCGHMLVDPSRSFAMLCRGCLVSSVCSILSCSPMQVRSEKDSLVRELVICHSTINAYVLRVRLRGHYLWFLTATCKGYKDT